MAIAENLKHIKDRLPATVTLVAVSKTKTAEAIMEAYNCGHRDFGENYVQELVAKAERLPKDIRWHFIGHLQSNKVKFIAPFVHLIHGVDSMKLLKEIGKQGLKAGRNMACLLQLHIAREESKFGFSYEECREAITELANSGVQGTGVLGLMAMASNVEDKDQIRREFMEFAAFFREMKTILPQLQILSCGMSQDYPLALEAGSNMLRIGSSIFGERQYGAENG